MGEKKEVHKKRHGKKDQNNSTKKQQTQQNLEEITRHTGADIAIIGMACRFPGARNYNEFADNLLKGINSIQEIPPSRWDIDTYYSPNFDEPNKSISKWCGLIDNIDKFDNHFFAISPREANNMDPQQRLLLEETWHCIEDSGISHNRLKDKITSVYVGVMATDYHHESSAPDVIVDSYAGLGNYDCILANRLSYFYGFRGQSEAINAACASSLVALHEAKRSLLLKESDYALSAGVSLNFHPWKYISFSKSRMLSPDGQCKTFDKDANGYVPGEGVGVLLMQRLEDAIREGNHIYGIIKGSAVNHGGKTLSITAPRVQAQRDVILAAYKDAGFSPDTVSYMEAHGTGTSLGDPIEVEALTKAFRQYSNENQFCKIGSVKSNIGHLEAAAGIAGVIKVLLMMKHRKIPQSLNIKTLNPIINFEKSPFAVATEQSTWERGEGGIPLRAGVSSFGFGGTNSHCLLEEYTKDHESEPNEPGLNQLFILSAKSSNSLKKLIDDWRLFVAGKTFSENSLRDICLTLKTERGNFPYRWGVHLRNKNTLHEALNDASPSAPEKNKKYWCFRIGDFLFDSLTQYTGYLKRFDLFKQHLQEIMKRSHGIEGIDEVLKNFQTTSWSDENKPLYSFMLVYAGALTLMDIGFIPHVVTGEKAGTLVGLVISGILKLEDALALLSKQKKLHEITFSRPTIPYYDSVIKKTVMPFHFTETYLRLLIDELSRQNKLLGHLLVDGILYTQETNQKAPDNHFLGNLLLRNKVITKEQLEDALAEQHKTHDLLGNIIVEKGYCSADALAESLKQQDILRYYVHETFRYYVDKARMLNTSQFTFKRYLEEWDVILKKFGQSIIQLLHDDMLFSPKGKRVRNEKLLIMIIIMNCLRKLNQKWNLTEQKLVDEKRFYELLDLVTDGVMPKEDCIELFLDDNPDYARIANTLNRRQAYMNLSNTYRFIKKSNPNIREIEDVSRWLTETMETENILPEDNLAYLPLDDIAFYEFGKFTATLPVESTVHLKMTGKITEQFTDSLLKIWLHGVNMQWERLYREGSYKKVQLPLYPFDQKSFWLPHDESQTLSRGVHHRKVTTITDKENEKTRVSQKIETKFSIKDPIIHDHVITGENLIPGASLIELGLESAEKAVHTPVKELKNIIIQNPCIVDNEASLGVIINPDEKRFILTEDTITLCTGEYDTKGSLPHNSFDISSIINGQPLDISGLYPSLARRGYQYGDSLHMIKTIWQKDGIFVVELTKLTEEEDFRTRLNPRILDGIFQSALATEYVQGRFPEDTMLFVPYFIKSLSIAGKIKDRCFVCFAEKNIERKGKDLQAGFGLYELSGKCILLIHDMLYKCVPYQFLSAYLKAPGKSSLNHLDDLKAYYYSPYWIKQSLGNPDVDTTGRTAIIVGDDNDLSRHVLNKLSQKYTRTFVIKKGASFTPDGDGTFFINAQSEHDYVTVIQRIVTQEDATTSAYDMYFLWAYEPEARAISDTEDLRAKQEQGVQSLFYVAKALTKARVKHAVTITVGTNSIHPVEAKDAAEGYGFGGLFGLAKTIMLENPKIDIKIIDFDRDNGTHAEKARTLIKETLAHGQANVIAYRNEGRYIQSYKQAPTIESAHKPLVKNDGVYCLIGGAGGIGMKVTQMLANLAKARLILIDRAVLSPEKEATIEQLKTKGCEIHYYTGDITNYQEMEALIKTIKATHGNINGVLQAVGFLEDKLLVSKNWESFYRVMAPKVEGTWIINHLTQQEPLDFFIVFSSIVSVVGNIGQVDYAAANSFLDALIQHRIHNNYPGKSVSINWTLWADGGMGLQESTKIGFEKRGLPPLPSQKGLRALENIIQYGESGQVAVLSKKLEKFEYPNIHRHTDFLNNQPLKDGETIYEESTHKDNQRNERDEEYEETISEEETKSYPYENPQQDNKDACSEQPEDRPRRMPQSERGYEIAVIGMSGRFPKAPTLDVYWQNLVEGKDCIEEIPRERWEYNQFFDPDPNKPNKSYGKWGGFIEDIDKFDPLFFNISPREAEQMDPQQRLLLECTWGTMEDAGYGDRNTYKDKLVGLFIGAMWNEYSLIANQNGFLKNEYCGPGSIYWAIANRISYIMDFKGPSIALDTACSSSLVAMHLACQSILHGDSDIAIAGGVNLSMHPSKYIYLSQSRFLSQDGRCRSFGINGTGYVPGEGVGAVLLKSLDKARADGDHIYGVIRGSSTNHGGKATGFTVPNPEAHTSLIVKAFERAHISPEQIGYIECHGTGTALGDPIEIRGLTKAFEQYTHTKQFCPIGSVKSNIGHLEAAAGVAALIKVLLCMEHNQIPKSLHSEVKNPNIAFDTTPFYVVNETTDWQATHSKPMVAGISSFGAGGANAHLVVESYASNEAPAYTIQTNRESAEPHLIVLSAKNQQRLQEYAHKMAEYLKNTGHRLVEIAYTLQVGREAMDERIALLASSIEEAREKLSQYCQGNQDIEGFYQGNVRKNKAQNGKDSSGEHGEESVQTPIAQSKRASLAQHWVQGARIEWDRHYPSVPPCRIPLPTYPFAKKHYWISDTMTMKSDAHHKSVQSEKLHPLLDQNLSTLHEGRFQTLLTGNEFFLTDHVVDTKKILPGVAFIEMARAAAEIAGRRKVQKLRDIIWLRPIIVDSAPCKVSISLVPQKTDLDYRVMTYGEGAETITHAQGKIIYAAGESSHNEKVDKKLDKRIDIDAIRNRCSIIKSSDDTYKGFEQSGFQYGLRFRAIERLWLGEVEGLSLLSFPPELRENFQDFALHPSLMDGALQTVLGHIQYAEQTTGITYLPFSISEVELLQPLGEKCYAHITYDRQNVMPREKRYSIELIDQAGNILLTMTSIALRVLAAAPTAKPIFYKTMWETSPVTINGKIEEHVGPILLFAHNERMLSSLNEQLAMAKGAHILLVKPGNCFQKLDNSVFTINPAQKEDYHTLMDAIKDHGELTTIIHYWSNNWAHDGSDDSSHEQSRSVETNLRDHLEKSIYSVLYLTQACMQQRLKGKITMLYAYQADRNIPQPLDAAISGFARTLAKENSKFAYKVIEIGKGAAAAEIIGHEIKAGSDGAIEVRYSGDERQVKQIIEYDVSAADTSDSKPPALKEKGVYVITGGMGGLGLVFAKYLAKKVQARLVLTGRSPLSDEKKEKIKELESLGSEVIYMRADVSESSDVHKLVRESISRFDTIHGIIHSAGLIRDSFIIKKTKNEFDAVLAPKVFGTLHLDEATKDVDLDFIVLFSSITAVMGNPGQCDYAYGNSFMDNFAILREGLRRRGERKGKIISINWPLWKEGGMRVDEQTEEWMKKRIGMAPLKTYNGIKAFEEALVDDATQIVVVEGDKEKLNKQLGVTAPVEAPRSLPQDQPPPPSPAMSSKNIHKQVEQELTRLFAELLKVDEKELDADVDLGEYGLDSIIMMTVLNRIESLYGDTVEPNALTEYPTIESFAQYLIDQGIVKYESVKTSPSQEHTKPSIVQSTSGDLQKKVEDDLTGLFAELLKVDEKELDTDVDLGDYGLDSIIMMTVLNRIESLYGDTVEPNALSEYPTIESFAQYLIEKGIVKSDITSPDTSDPASFTQEGTINTESTASMQQSADTPSQTVARSRFISIKIKAPSQPRKEVKRIAVIGAACRFPQSNSLESFWDNLCRGKNLITQVPEDRWAIADYYSPDKKAKNKTYSKWGGFIQDIDLFDAQFFSVSDENALVIDPQQRILLELTQELLDRAGYGKDDMNQTRTGVFIGGAESSYVRENIDSIPEHQSKHMLINTIQNMMTARISDFYNLKGPSQTIDSACSSSLVAIHQACRHIKDGECDMAVVGGIELLIDPFYFIGFSKAEVLSDEGTSYVFDERAKGIVLGEGAGLILLKSYEKAVEDGDQIMAVILGSAVNNDGHTMGLTVPSLEGQREVIQQAIKNSEVSPDTISYLEAHGTGTLLGDPIEIKAATQVYREYTQDTQFCAVGSVKSNMGHLLHASGIASVIKVLLALQHKQIPATLHCERPHPRFKFEISPFYPISQAREWIPRQDVRRAAVSSFGFGGTNCHLVAEGFDTEKRGYVPMRKSVLLTHFKRKRFWLGKPVLDEKEVLLKKIFDQFTQGYISEDEAKRQVQLLEI
ncbi:MAG: SDR family NAD(P)-dependent oxidoreductase [bacterium]